MKAIELLKDYIEDESRLGDLNYAHYSNIIDYVNEAIVELEDIQNRSCDNCKHYKQSSSQDYKSCYEIKINGFNLESEKDFYCNKWESK